MTIDSETSSSRDTPVLEVEGLRVRLHRGGEPITIVDGVTFDVAPASSTALVGESGAGKSVSVRAVLGLLDDRRFEVTGSVRYGGVDVLGLPTKERRRRVASFASLVFQDPTRSLNPTMRIGWQVAEAMLISDDETKRVDKQEAKARALQLLRDVGIADPEERFFSYPHQLSGGMRQRVVMAAALIAQPRLLIADEPTTALDVRVQEQVLDLLEEQSRELDLAVLFITHDLAIVAGLAQRVAVMFRGRLVEDRPVDDLFAHPDHPYTRALIGSIPRLDADPDVRLRTVEDYLVEGSAA